MEAISATKYSATKNAALFEHSIIEVPGSVSAGQPFGVVLEKIFSASEMGSGFHSQLSNIQSRVLSGTKFTPRDLLLLQMQMGRFSMQVELVSKVAESATTTLRKIQNS